MMIENPNKSEPWPIVRLYLRFYSENSDPGEHFDPDEITRRLGIEPTTQFRPGDPITKDGEGRRRRSGWMLKIADQESLHIDGMLQQMQERVGLAGAAIPRICEDLQIEAVFLCGVLRNDSALMPALIFPPSFINWADALGASINVDVVL
jgi:Domain of unknown function (DUF4279)